MFQPDHLQQVLHRLGGQGSSMALFGQLFAAYSQPHRAYHTLAHIKDCLAQLDRVRQQVDRVDEIEIALWFHDAIYDPQARDNEEQSAAWAGRCLREFGINSAVIDRVVTMILATRHQQVPSTWDCELLLDIDLSILGRTPEEFAVYEDQIRQEYVWVPEDQYRSGRATILAQFLNRPTIYYTHFFQSLEDLARHNLERSLTRLR